MFFFVHAIPIYNEIWVVLIINNGDKGDYEL
jgi:hypothetical protein